MDVIKNVSNQNKLYPPKILRMSTVPYKHSGGHKDVQHDYFNINFYDF